MNFILLTPKHFNKKLNKNFLPTYNLSLLPHRLNSKKINLCPFSTKDCRDACLTFSGRGHFSNVIKAREKRTEFFINNKFEFLNQLNAELTYLNLVYKTVLVRLNTLTDINWKEEFKLIGINLEDFNNIQFYDYTKVKDYILNKTKNQYFTFSYSGKNWKDCKELLDKNICNVAMVFKNEIPIVYDNYEVILGDDTDERHLEGSGKIVGLKYKISRKNKLEKSNFVL